VQRSARCGVVVEAIAGAAGLRCRPHALRLPTCDMVGSSSACAELLVCALGPGRPCCMHACCYFTKQLCPFPAVMIEPVLSVSKALRCTGTGTD
jgi:hypothetical protein